MKTKLLKKLRKEADKRVKIREFVIEGFAWDGTYEVVDTMIMKKYIYGVQYSNAVSVEKSVKRILILSTLRYFRKQDGLNYLDNETLKNLTLILT